MIHKLSNVCGAIMGTFKQVCDDIGMPISPDKSVGPVQFIKFLDLTLDSILMVVQIPLDKLEDIQGIIIKMAKKRKVTGWELELLAGQLNFISRVIPTGCSLFKEFIKLSWLSRKTYILPSRHQCYRTYGCGGLSWLNSEDGIQLWI